jgi:hypothetical protein
MLPATNNLVSKMVKSLQQKLTVGAALGKFFQYLRTEFSHIALFADAPSFASDLIKQRVSPSTVLWRRHKNQRHVSM